MSARHQRLGIKRLDRDPLQVVICRGGKPAQRRIGGVEDELGPQVGLGERGKCGRPNVVSLLGDELPVELTS